MKKEEINLWLDHGVDFKNRSIYLDAEIDSDNVNYIIRAIKTMAKSNEPIHLYISTYGGEVYDGLGLYDVIEEHNVFTYAVGKVMSMGVILFLGGKNRSAGRNTTFMIHQVSAGSSGKLLDLEIDTKETKRLNDKLMKILENKTKHTARYWKSKTNKGDCYLSFSGAVKAGLINDAQDLTQAQK